MLHPQFVFFDNITCCSLENWHGRRKGERRSYRPWPTVDIHLGHFINTKQMGFPVEEVHRKILNKAISSEIRHLKRQTTSLLPCGHSSKEHISALESTLSRMRLPPVTIH